MAGCRGARPTLLANDVNSIQQALNQIADAMQCGGGGSGAGTVFVDGSDTTADFLFPKLVAGPNIVLTILGAPGYERIRITAVGGSFTDELVKVNAADTTAGYLADKLVAGANITLTPIGVGNEQLRVDSTAGGTGSSLEDTAPCAVPVTAGQPMAMLPTGFLVPADAAVGGNQEVYGLAKAASAPGIITVITSGVCAYTGPPLIPGTVLFLELGGGVRSAPIDAAFLAVPGRKVARLGIARSAGSIMVRVQDIMET